MLYILERYRLAPRNPDDSHRAATPLELFFDLISVIAIASVTAGLHHAISEGHGLEALPRFLFLFTAIWWAWMNFTWFASAFDNDGPLYRLLVMVIMTGELIFAGGAGYIFETLDMSWGIAGWCIMRIGMAALWFRAAGNPEYRETCIRYGIGILIAQLGWVAMYFLVPPGSSMFFVAGTLVFLLEFSVPPFAESKGVTPFHRHHMIERYGLLTIISLGEIMLSISHGFGMLFGEHANFASASTALAAVVIVFTLFWIYFCLEEHLRSREFMPVFIWGYTHVFIFGGIAALGAAISAELDLAAHHSEANPDDIAIWLGASLAVILVALWVARDRNHALGTRQLALPVMAVVSLIGAWIGLSTWGFAIIAAIALIWRVRLSEPQSAH
ncbi:MAG: low temperature requirement protein A [Paracoccus sp. (in: a-proteobacteria)]